MSAQKDVVASFKRDTSASHTQVPQMIQNTNAEDPLAAFMTGGMFSSGAPKVMNKLGSPLPKAEKNHTSEAAPTDPLAAFISGGKFSSGAPNVENAPAKVEAKLGAAATDPLAAFISGGKFSSGAPKVENAPAKVEAKLGAAPTDPLAAFISGGKFSSGAPKVENAPAKVEAKVGAAPIDPLTAFIGGSMFASGEPAVDSVNLQNDHPAAADGATDGIAGLSAEERRARIQENVAIVEDILNETEGLAEGEADFIRLMMGKLGALPVDPFAPDEEESQRGICEDVTGNRSSTHAFDIACSCCAPEGDLAMSNPALGKMMGVRGKQFSQFDF